MRLPSLLLLLVSSMVCCCCCSSCCHSRMPVSSLMYLMAERSISFFDSFLSGGCVGTSLRSSAKAPDTFCCRQRSLVLVNTLRTPPLPPEAPPPLPAALPSPVPRPEPAPVDEQLLPGGPNWLRLALRGELESERLPGRGGGIRKGDYYYYH